MSDKIQQLVIAAEAKLKEQSAASRQFSGVEKAARSAGLHSYRAQFAGVEKMRATGTFMASEINRHHLTASALISAGHAGALADVRRHCSQIEMIERAREAEEFNRRLALAAIAIPRAHVVIGLGPDGRSLDVIKEAYDVKGARKNEA